VSRKLHLPKPWLYVFLLGLFSLSVVGLSPDLETAAIIKIPLIFMLWGTAGRLLFLSVYRSPVKTKH
jgi:hypothetical protein